MAVLTTRQIGTAGSAPAPAAASAGGDRAECGPTNFLYVKNGGGASITVTVDSVAPCNYGFDHDLSVAVPAGAERQIGPLKPERFASNTDSLAAVTYSAVTSVTVEAVRV